jgi:hypothetical protein
LLAGGGRWSFDAVNPKRYLVPPSSWYVAVNVPLGVCWGIGVPVAVGIGFSWPGRLTTVVAVVWFVLNARVIDRSIPVVTKPIIEWLYRAVSRE